MQSGTLTVTGKNETHILLSGRPREVVVYFKEDNHHHHPCNHHHDHLHFHVIHKDEDVHKHHKIGHHHHDRQFFLEIEWDVDGVREIFWLVFY